MKIKTLATIAAIGLAAFSVQPAKAISYSLTAGNPAISGYPGPYASVTVTWIDSDDATITFQAGDVGAYHYLLGGQGAAGVNVNAATFTTSGLSGSGQPQPNSAGPSVSFAGSGNEDGWGSFNLTVDSFDGFQYSVKTITFSVHNTSGTWGSDADVLAPNGSGYRAAAHIFVANSDYSGDALSTGYATNVPDGGATIALFGFALLGIDFLRRKFSRA